jgi:hypothetical protein
MDRKGQLNLQTAVYIRLLQPPTFVEKFNSFIMDMKNNCSLKLLINATSQTNSQYFVSIEVSRMNILFH